MQRLLKILSGNYFLRYDNLIVPINKAWLEEQKGLLRLLKSQTGLAAVLQNFARQPISFHNLEPFSFHVKRAKPNVAN